MTRSVLPAAAVALTLAAALTGCGGERVEQPGEAPAPPAALSWLDGLPERAPAAAPGAAVWAVVPGRGTAVLPYRLEAVDGTRAVLSDALGTRYEDVPGALVHPLATDSALEVGAPVLAAGWPANNFIGRVVSFESETPAVAYDWNGETMVGYPAAATPLEPAGEVLRWVVYPTAEGRWRGLVIAAGDDRLWVRDDAGYVTAVSAEAVEPLAPASAGLETGDTVETYSWSHGFRRGTVVEELEPGLRYAVELEGGEIRPFFFDRLARAG